jgi:serine/threonine-protein kinase RsbT
MTRGQAVRTEIDITVALSLLRTDAVALEFGEYDIARVLTAASELGHNILKYAGSGDISYSRSVDGTKLGLALVARDNGPGIADVDQAMTDEYNSSGTLGLGLPGIKRMVDEFELASEAGVGTTVTIKVWKP